MRVIFIALHVIQIIFSIITVGLSAAVRHKSGDSSSWINFYLYTSVSSTLVAIALLIRRLIPSGSTKAADIASIVVSAIWSIFWLASIAVAGQKGVLSNSGSPNQLYGNDYYITYYGQVVYQYGYDSSLGSIWKADWSFGFFLLLLWIAVLVLSVFGLLRGPRTEQQQANPQLPPQQPETKWSTALPTTQHQQPPSMPEHPYPKQSTPAEYANQPAPYTFSGVKPAPV